MNFRFLAILLLSPPAFAAPPPLVLNTFTLHPRLSNYRVTVPSCATFGSRLVSIQIRQLSGKAYADRVILIYADKQTQVVKVGNEFNANEVSPMMDLGVEGFHDSRCVSELFLTAKSSAALGQPRPRMQVLGVIQKTPSP